MTALVTGGAGFIGSALVRGLLADGIPVVVVDALTYAGSRSSLGEYAEDARLTFCVADIRDTPTMAELLVRHRPATIYHLAAESHVDRSIESPDAFVTTNVLGTASLLQAALAHWRGLRGDDHARFRFVHVSTDEVFGDLDDDAPPFTPDSPYAPSSPYAASKAGADHLVRAWHRTYGLPTVVSNCSNNYGPYQVPEKLVPLTILNALDGRPLPVYGSGRNIRDWIWVEDHVAALRLAAAAGRVGATYLVGARSQRRNIDLVNTICGILDRLAPAPAPHAGLIRMVADRPGHDRRYAIDPALAESELGWRATVDLEAGLERTVAWYRDNRAWCEASRARLARARAATAPA
ncbi:MAG: dTDP-glucose 4,6-dehydratase [Alphaproteobacteria bacterium]|nr:dTDP-glucose 4,6-dehydratase [Alphaproteobacteria bacterium]